MTELDTSQFFDQEYTNNEKFSISIEQQLQKNAERMLKLNIETEKYFFKISVLKTKIITLHKKIKKMKLDTQTYKLEYFNNMQTIFCEIMQLFIKSKHNLSELKILLNSSKSLFENYKLKSKEYEQKIESFDIDTIDYTQDLNFTKETLLQSKLQNSIIYQEDEIKDILIYSEIIYNNGNSVFDNMATLVMECITYRNEMAKIVRDSSINVNINKMSIMDNEY